MSSRTIHERMVRASFCACVAVMYFCPAFSADQPVFVRNGDELRAALKDAKPGTVIEVSTGEIDLDGPISVGVYGEPRRPVIVRAKQRGKTVLIAESRFVCRSAGYVQIEGFAFACIDGPAVLIDGSHHVRVTRNSFKLKESKRSSWLEITGASHHNRVDHNIFRDKKQLGNFVTIEGNRFPQAQVSQFDTIDHNHFLNIGPRAENVLEAIRVGSSDYSLSNGGTVLESNLFERCDGDPEYISIKSSGNAIRYNTFRECLGSLSLRHGNRNRVEGNFIFGGGRTGVFVDSTGKRWMLGTGGVRLCGDSMVIVNNYFEGLTGREWDATLAIPNGDADYGEGLPLTKHYRIRDAVIAFNTLVNNASNVEIGYDGGGFQNNWWKRPVRGILVANNVIVGDRDTLIRLITPPEDAVWQGNVVHATGKAVTSGRSIEGVRVGDPMLVMTKGVWRLDRRSPLVGAAMGKFGEVVDDIDGQLRGERKDVGADQVSDAPVRRRPLTAQDVRPWAK
jgi:poly(beta-D-mannuronate) lyase